MYRQTDRKTVWRTQRQMKNSTCFAQHNWRANNQYLFKYIHKIIKLVACCCTQIEDQTKLSKFEQEIRDEQEERRQVEEEKRQRRTAFKNTVDIFKQMH